MTENYTKGMNIAIEDLANEQNRLGFYSVLNDFNINEMLSKYGPEGCFILANALQEAAQNDTDSAMKFSELEMHPLLSDTSNIPCRVVVKDNVGFEYVEIATNGHDGIVTLITNEVMANQIKKTISKKKDKYGYN